MTEKTPWPLAAGSFTLGSVRSPVAIAVVGRARFKLAPHRYRILGHLRSANLWIEKIVVNIISNPGIRFLIICGREEGHLPGDALISLARNGVDGDMGIVGTKAQLPFLSDLTPSAVDRFREQVRIVDLVDPKETEGIIDWQDPPFDLDATRTEELEDAVNRCERVDPGPYPAAPIRISLPEPLQSGTDAGTVLKEQVDRISGLMLRMPSEELSTSSDDVIISPEFEVLADPIDGAIMQVPSLAFYARMKAYLTGQ